MLLGPPSIDPFQWRATVTSGDALYDAPGANTDQASADDGARLGAATEILR
jgi:hypothetical protein